MDVIAEFTDNMGLTAKLTSDRIHISGLGSEETFPLRSIVGIGIYDEIVDYNDKLKTYKAALQKKVDAGKKSDNTSIFAVIAGFSLLIGFFLEDGIKFMFIFLGLIVLIIAAVQNFSSKPLNPDPPHLKSYFKILFLRGEKVFTFNKHADSSTNITDFINALEDKIVALK